MKNSNSVKKMEEISALLQKANSFSTKKFLHQAEKLKISKSTLRRYLHQLEELGYITLTYGNIEVLKKEIFKVDQQNKPENLDKLRMIATKANSLLDDNDNIFVSNGKTMEMFVKNIKIKINLLCTNSLSVALFAVNNDNIREIFLTGGRLSKEKKSCVGSMSRNVINQLIFNHIFTGFDSYDDNFIYLNNIDENNIIKEAIKHSKKISVFGTKEKKFNKGVIQLIEILKVDNLIII